MHMEIEYRGGQKYGNLANAPRYNISVSRDRRRSMVTVEFTFDSPAHGRGVGEFQGAVQRGTISLPSDAGAALAHTIRAALANMTDGPVALRIDETPSPSLRTA